MELWASPNDYADGKWNPSPALGRAVESLRAMFPHGPQEVRPRGSDGRYTGPRPRPARPTRPQLEARIRELERELARARGEADGENR